MEVSASGSHDLKAHMELRQQLEDAAAIPKDGAPERQKEKEPELLASTRTRTPSPRPRPLAAVQREEELRETFCKASQRSSWNPEFHSDGRWNGRHQLAYCNDEMSQNCRCYFDRWLDHRELLPPDADVQVQKPSWRLEPDGVSSKQRKVERLSNAIYSVTGPGLRGSSQVIDVDTAELSKENVIKRRAMRISRERPWEHPPAPLFLSQRRTARNDSSTISAATQTDLGSELPDWAKEQGWDSHHHATWSNFQNLQGSILNPAPVRSYFDRPRDPEVGARSAEKKPSSNVRDGVVRVLPLWRLEPLPGATHVETPEGGVWPRTEPLVPRSGRSLQKREDILGIRHDASPEFKHKSTWSCPSLLTTTPSRETVERQEKWNSRHQLTFQNEEVSKLDRSYFDRFREHNELRTPDSPRHDDCSVWNLGKDISTKASAKKIISASESRFRADGKWMHRHQLIFDNAGGRMPVQRNLRCYFDRARDFPSEASPKQEDVLPEDVRRGTFTFLTESSRCKRRGKLKNSEDAGKLKVDVWSLVEQPSRQKAPRIEETFRSSEGELGMSKTQKEKRRSNWLANHHVVF
mmetsp:Transcript_29040/g.67292  ORF Transcript_29040/g.67292 Transcript_29040/m.67292 type:complete len:579 (+) Transcript_29040:63-1799(+)